MSAESLLEKIAANRGVFLRCAGAGPASLWPASVEASASAPDVETSEASGSGGSASQPQVAKRTAATGQRTFPACMSCSEL